MKINDFKVEISFFYNILNIMKNFTTFIRPKLLYWGFVSTKLETKISSGKEHSHNDYWQLDILLEGKCKAIVDNKNYSLSAGDMLLVPPKIFHIIKYDIGNKICTLKFLIDDDAKKNSFLIKKSNYSMGIIKSIENLINSFFPKQYFDEIAGTTILNDDNYQHVVEYLIRAIFDLLIYDETTLGEISKQLKQLMNKQVNNFLTVQKAAEILGYSNNYLSVLIKKETNLTAQEFMTKERIKLAKNYLDYSDLNIQNIATKLGFSSSFYFSNFFSKQTGMSPRFYRNRKSKCYI